MMWFTEFVIIAVVLNISTVNMYMLEELCPAQEFCNFTPTYVNKTKPYDTTACCLPCSCDPDCANVGNCCLDIGDIAPAVRPLECYLPVVNIDDVLMATENAKTFGSIQRYMTVTTCPEMVRNDILRMNCEGMTFEYPDDLVMVVDDNGRLFKNKFCALCNGVESYSSWQLKLRSSFMEEGIMYTPSKPFQDFENCMFWSKPSDPELYKGSRCFSSFDVCNVTGEWTESDAGNIEYTKEMCGGFTMYYMHFRPLSETFDVYKNVFCYLCNTKQFSMPDAVCELDSGEQSFRQTYQFSALLSNQLFANEIPVETAPTHHPCGVADVYDPTFDKCRSLLCPQHSIPMLGRCEKTFEQATGVAVRLVITAQSPNVSTETELQMIYDNQDDILAAIESILSLTDHTCIRCDAYVLGKHADGFANVAFITKYKTTENCDMVFLLSLLRHNDLGLQNEFIVSIELEEMTFNYTILPGDTPVENLINEGFYEIIEPSGVLTCPISVVYLTEERFCPRIEFSEEEYDSLKSTKIMPETYRMKNGTESRRFVMCMEDYMTMTAGGRTLMAVTNLTIGVIVFGAIFLY